MKQAWMMYRNKFYGYTFAQALKMAWYYAKVVVDFAENTIKRIKKQ